MRLWLCAAFAAATALSACGPTSTPSSVPSGDALTLAGQFVVPANPTAAPQLRVGGLSGLASIGNGRELLALADDRDNPRVFRMAVSADANAFRVDVERIIYLHPAPAAIRHLDPEGIAVTREGHMLITSEGVANDEARLSPTITEYLERRAIHPSVECQNQVCTDGAREDHGRRSR